MTNQLMDNFFALSGILIEKCSFYVSCQFNAKSGAIDQLGLGNRPFDRDRLGGHPCIICLKQNFLDTTKLGWDTASECPRGSKPVGMCHLVE